MNSRRNSGNQNNSSNGSNNRKLMFSFYLNSLKLWIKIQKQENVIEPNKKYYELNSFPGSGNTWCRSVVEKLTGYFTGSVYNGGLLVADGLMGGQVSRR